MYFYRNTCTMYICSFSFSQYKQSQKRAFSKITTEPLLKLALYCQVCEEFFILCAFDKLLRNRSTSSNSTTRYYTHLCWCVLFTSAFKLLPHTATKDVYAHYTRRAKPNVQRIQHVRKHIGN